MATFSRRVPSRPPAVSNLVAGLATAIATVVVTAAPSAAAADDVQPPVAIDFGSVSDADAFRPIGPGSWSVRRGGYVLDAREAEGSGRPMSLLQDRVRAKAWRLTVSVRSLGDRRRADASLVFGYRRPGSYTYVHLDRDRSESGVYVVREGHHVKVARVSARLLPHRTRTLEVRRDEDLLSVFVGSSTRRHEVGSVRLGSWRALRAGLGTWGSSARFDDLTIDVPDGSVDEPTTDPPDPTPPPGGRAVAVVSSAELSAALAGALPGDVITMADGVYTTKGTQATLAVGGKRYYGTFVAERSGTSALPVILQGTRNAVIDGMPGGDGAGTQYGLYLAGANHMVLRGFTVTNVAKGVVLDRSSHVSIEGLAVDHTGQEGIHLRSFSSDNLVQGNVVSHTGLKNATFGEGLYVGSANSNWGTYSDGLPDRSDRNRLIGNTIRDTGAESMDIKEGTTGGVIQGNVMDGSGMTGSWADSWIDMKGNDWLIVSNKGVDALKDGFQVHTALAGWGNDNIFRSNTAAVNASGYGFWLQSGATGNVIDCGNTVTGAGSGLANVACAAS